MAVPARAFQGSGDGTVSWLQGADAPPYIIFTVGDKGLLKAWNPITKKMLHSEVSPHAAKGALRQVHYLTHARGARLMTVGEDMNLVIWSLPELKVAGHVMGHNEEIVHVQLIPQLSWPASPEENLSRDEEDDAASAGVVGMPSARGGVRVAAERFVAIVNDEHPRVVNCKGFGASLLRGHTDVVIACDVSADGSLIATGGKDQTVRVWSSAECRCVCLLTGHVSAISALSFPKKRPKGPQGAAVAAGQPSWLVSGSQDKTMKVWELPSAEQLHKAAGKMAKSCS